MSRIAFIGLGIMGKPMAGHLLKAGHSVTVHNRTQSKAQSLLDAGARWAGSPGEAAKDAEVVFICVPDTPDVQGVLDGDTGVLKHLGRGTIVVDHSTISPFATREFARRAADHGAQFLDAPISGGDSGAKAGTLSIMVGGDAQAFEKALPLLKCYGKTIVHCGPSGAGQLTKLVNQVLVSVTNLAVSEALNLALASGLDPNKTLEAVGGGAAGSWQLANLGPKMAKSDFAPGFMIDLQQKDLRLVLEAATHAKSPTPATALVNQLFTAAQAHGHGREGTQALFRVLQMLGGPRPADK